MKNLARIITKDRRTGRYGYEKAYKNPETGVIERYSKGWLTSIENPRAKNSKMVTIAQSGAHYGFTATLDKKDGYKEIGHSIHGEELARKMAKKYKKIQFLD